jgi:molecular chaperone GrpE
VSEQVKNEEVLNEEEVNAAEETVVEELTPEELLQQQIQELETRTLRIQADYDNYRRRTLQEKEEFAKYASKNVVEKLLPVLDNLERALQASEGNADFDALKKGLDMVFKQFEMTLEGEGLTAIPSVGEPFDPNHHQAIMTVDSDEHEEGIVVEEVMKGYKLKDRVIRPAMVKVSN